MRVPGDGVLRPATIKRRSLVLESFWHWMLKNGIDDPRKLTRLDLQDWVVLRRKDRRDSTLATDAQAVRLWLEEIGFGGKWKGVRLPKVGYKTPVALDPGKDTAIRMWFATTGERQWLIYALTRWAALRIGEALHLRWDDVDTAKARIHIREDPGSDWAPKTHEERIVETCDPLTKTLRKHRMQARREKRSSPYVTAYRGDDGDWHQYTAWPRNCLRRCSITVMNGEELTWHIFRKTCLTRMIQNGVPLPVVSKFAGHANLTSTQRYLDPEVLKEAGFQNACI